METPAPQSPPPRRTGGITPEMALRPVLGTSWLAGLGTPRMQEQIRQSQLTDWEMAQAQRGLEQARKHAEISRLRREATALRDGRGGERCECCNQLLPRQSQANPVGRAYPRSGPAST